VKEKINERVNAETNQFEFDTKNMQQKKEPKEIKSNDKTSASFLLLCLLYSSFSFFFVC